MGHYDDCYEADERKQERKAARHNKELLKQAESPIDELDGIIDALRIEKYDKKHLEDKLREFRALLRFLGN